MSDSVCDVKPAEADGFAMPAVLLESQRPIISGRINPTSVLPGSLPSKRHEAYLLEDNSLSADSTPHACGETATLLGLLSPSIERPKSGLTKTKRNLKKQLHLKMAALDDGRQTPNLPSPNPYPEDARASAASVVMATASAKEVGSVEQTACHEEKPHEPSSTTECLNVTIKVELPDDDYPSSSQAGISSTKQFKSFCPNKRHTVSENAVPSPADALSQSGPEAAGPTKWIIGDMLWARVSGHPWWPCMVAYDPAHTAFTRTLKRRQGSLVQYHVRFFGDENERGWINESSIIPFDGLEAFTKFCNEMMTLHKKDRQNYIVSARRLKAWNIAVKSAQEAYPMTRSFRVHHFAFVYNEPVVANGTTIAPEQRLVSTPLSKKGIKRSRSSSVGGSGDSQPKKRQRTSGEKTSLTGGSIPSQLPKTSCMSPGSGAGDQVDRDNSVSCDTISQHEPGSAVFRSRAEGVKRSSRFVKPTNRIMEHLEEVQQRKRTKLRPHRKLVAHDDSTSPVLTSEMPAKAWKPDGEENLTSSDETLQNVSQVTCDNSVSNAMTSETPLKEKKPELLDNVASSSKEANETYSQPAETLDSTESTDYRETNSVEKVNQNLQEDPARNDLPDKMDTGILEKSAEVHSPDKIVSSSDSPEDMTITDSQEDIPAKMTNSDSPDEVLTEPAQTVQAISMVTEAAYTLEDVVKVKVEQSFDQSSNQCEALANFSPCHPRESHDLESLGHKHKSPEEAAMNSSWPDCEPVASTPMAVPINEEAQASLLQSAEVIQGPTVKKRQKRTFKKNKDSIGSNLRSLRNEATAKIAEASEKYSPPAEASEKDSLPTEERVPVPMKVYLSAAELSSSSLPPPPPPPPPPEKQKKPPGRRKRSVSTAQLVEEDGNAILPKAESDITTDGIFSSSPPTSRFRSQPEFQRLSSLAPQKVDKVCHICEQSGDVLIDCQGPCYGSYHLSCLGLVVSPVGSFRCDECSTGNHPCFVCKHTSRDTVPCCASKCGRFYHRDCIGKFPLCKLDSNSVTCPHHTCATCAAESGKNGRSSKGLMYRCIRCPTAYHANDFCIAAGTVLIAGYNIICNSHLLTSKSPKRALLHVNATWCFTCSKEGSPLVLCSSCPAAYHPACAKIGQVIEPWQCKDCFVGKRPLYGEVVWAKVGNYRWWPGEVLHSKNLAVQILNKVHEPGNFVVRLYGTGFHFWIQQGRVFPFHEGDRLSHEPVYRKMTDIFEKAVSEAVEVYRLRLAAREAKTVSEREKNDQKPAYYKHIKVNLPLGDVEIYKVAPSEIPSCHCSPMMENPCGPDSDCINRLMMYECNALVCPAGEHCQNQRFQKREYADARPYKTEMRGWGLRSRADIRKGQFIAEYVGDLVDPEECNRRQEYAQRNNITNFYMLTLDKNRIIDAGPKGNYSRFMNHSCEPNCETQKWTVNGDIRVGLFALHDVPAGTELMFNYNLDCYGNQKTVCKCGSSICSGFLGVRPKTAAAMNVERKSREAKLKKQLKEMKSKDRPDVCYSCKKKGGELVICENPKCLKAYHPRCVKLSNNTDGKFICPWHKCEVCSQDASKLCSVCPRSFCLVHLTSNIFEISDGSLVCSKHQNVLVSCLQDGWNSSAVDGLSPGANGFSPASVGNHSNIVEASSQKCAKPARKQTAGNDNTPAPVKRRKVKVATEEEATANDFPQTEVKKRGRPMKNVQNGALEEAPEQNRVDSSTGSVGDEKLKTAPTRRSRSSAKAADKDNPTEVLAGRQKNVRDGQRLEEKAKKAKLAALDMSIHLKNEIPLSSGRLGTAAEDPTTANVEKLRTNGPDNRPVTLGRNTGLGVGEVQEDEFPRLVIDESF